MARQKQHRDSPPGGSQRQFRVGELVRHALADMLTRGDVHDTVICTGGPKPARIVSFSRRDFQQILKAKFGLADR